MDFMGWADPAMVKRYQHVRGGPFGRFSELSGPVSGYLWAE